MAVSAAPAEEQQHHQSPASASASPQHNQHSASSASASPSPSPPPESVGDDDILQTLRDIRANLEFDVFFSIRLGFAMLMEVIYDRLVTRHHVYLAEDCPEAWREALLDIFRFIVQRARDDTDFFAISHDFMCHVADVAVGASFFLHADVLSFFLRRFADDGALRSSAIYFFCCALHSPRTRNQYVQMAISSGLADRVLAHLPTSDAANENNEQHAWNLALNWIGGSDIGARFLLPHVPRVIEALARCEASQQISVTLTLILANFSAFLDDDPESRAQLLDAGLVETLLETAISGNIRGGSVGALMGLINLRVHVGESPALVVSDAMLSSLLQCLAFSLESRSQENILWSPWHPAQAVANLCLRADMHLRIIDAGFVPMLVRIAEGSYEGNQAEPEKDELYACKALAALSDSIDPIARSPHLLETLIAKTQSAETKEARAWAAVVVDAHRGKVGHLLPLALLARRAFRQSVQRAGFALYVDDVTRMRIPHQIKEILTYGIKSI